MSKHPVQSGGEPERLVLKEHAWPLYMLCVVCGIVGLILSMVLGFSEGDHFRRFFFAYLGSYCFFLAIALGGLFFTLLQHLTRAGWSVNLRRISEWFGAAMPAMLVLSAPIIISILFHGDLYPWAQAGAAADYPPFRKIWLFPAFFIFRLLFSLISWSVMGFWFWKQSIKQDISGDYRITARLQSISAPCMILFALTVTSTAFDLMMSLDPGWASTIFGVYYFADCYRAFVSVLVLIVVYLQARGFLRQSVTDEHFHDLGKWLFAFTFFWGYIAFSQYMLYWYGNMPDETEWYFHRGASTATGMQNGWTPVLLALLFGYFLIPFGGLMSRHVKRHRPVLAFWAIWTLVFAWMDIFWIVRPQLTTRLDFGLVDIAAFAGIGGVFFTVILRKAAHDALRPLQDPRLADSLAFENM